MSAETNRATAIKFLHGMDAHDGIDESLVSGDFQWWAPNAGFSDAKTFKSRVRQLRHILPTMPVLTIIGTVAENDKVAVEAEGKAELPDGRRYDNHYHFIFYFRGDRICMAKEYADTHLIAKTFGAPKE